MKLFSKRAAMEKSSPQKLENERLIHEIREIRDRLHAVESLYNLTCDSDMIDCYIHEINALDAHYRYLLRTIRERRMQCPAELLCISEERVCPKLG